MWPCEWPLLRRRCEMVLKRSKCAQFGRKICKSKPGTHQLSWKRAPRITSNWLIWSPNRTCKLSWRSSISRSTSKLAALCAKLSIARISLRRVQWQQTSFQTQCKFQIVAHTHLRTPKLTTDLAAVVLQPLVQTVRSNREQPLGPLEKSQCFTTIRFSNTRLNRTSKFNIWRSRGRKESLSEISSTHYWLKKPLKKREPATI